MRTSKNISNIKLKLDKKLRLNYIINLRNGVENEKGFVKFTFVYGFKYL